MKKYLLFFVWSFFVLLSVFGQAVSRDIPLENINTSLVDLKDARFFFLGPMDIYVEGLKYGNKEYVAVLRHDGAGNFSISAPAFSPAEIPQAIDLSSIKIVVSPEGKIRVTNLILDNMLWSGNLQIGSQGKVLVSEGFRYEGKVPETPAPDQSAQITRLQSQVTSLNTQVSDLKTQNQEIPVLRERVQTLNQRIPELETRVKSLSTQVDTLNRDLAERNSRIADLQNRLNNCIYITLPKLDKELVRGFALGKPIFGSWSHSGALLQQEETDQYFAKYVIPVDQRGNEFVYTFKGSSAHNGWVGLGLHFLASGSSAVNGYGYGSSYMLWLTRDPRNQTESSYIQLYQSFSDVHMVQIASAAIPFNVKDGVKATVYINRLDKEIRVFVNDYYAFTFPLEEMIQGGTNVVLRGLGRIKFESLSVWGK